MEDNDIKYRNAHRHTIEDNYKVGFDLDNLKPGIYPELMLNHPEYKTLVGTADRVEIYEDGTFDLSDYKTNEKLEFSSFQVYDQRLRRRTPKMMYEPVSHLEDCNGMHYTLQLSLYALFLEERGYKLGNMWINHVI